MNNENLPINLPTNMETKYTTPVQHATPVQYKSSTPVQYRKYKSACAVICEYDPFHSGHAYQLAQAREQSGCDYVVCIMSGSITQRGTLPVVDKYTRAKHALQNGADLVVQIPSVFSSANAQVFAQGAIKIVSQLKFVTHLSFGVESDNTLDLQKVANLLDNTEFGELVTKASKFGVPYPVALQHAMQEYYQDTPQTEFKLKPNAILAVEYLRAINQYCPQVISVPIPRTNEFDSLELESPHSSASAIRKHLQDRDIINIQKYLPYDIEDLNIKVDHNVYNAILVNHLKNTPLSKLKKVHSINEGLEYRLATVAKKYSTLDNIIKYTKSKRYVHSRIKRAILQNYLGITKEIIKKSTNKNTQVPFRILGINSTSTQILGLLPQSAIVKNTDIYSNRPDQILSTYYMDNFMDIFKEIVNRDVHADNLYCTCANLDRDLYFGTPLIKV